VYRLFFAGSERPLRAPSILIVEDDSSIRVA